MAWFKVDDKLHSHKKSARAGAEAMGLWVLAGSWCADQLTDGFIPDYMVQRIDPNGLELGSRLVRANLWERATNDGDDGFQFRDWAEYQPVKGDVEAKREDAKNRMRAARAARKQASSPERSREQSDERVVNFAERSPNPDPTRPDPSNTRAPRSLGDFDSFWKAYPRKVGKEAARKAYVKALRSASHGEVMEGVENLRLAVAGKDPQYTPHPSTWLNRGGWEDEMTPPEQDDDVPFYWRGPAVGSPEWLAQQEGQ